MSNFLPQYGTTEGPLGLPMRDKQAKAIETILKAIPQEDRELRRLVTAKAPDEVIDGERADVSWISSESPDRENEIVMARGMNDSQFAANPLVTMQHCYWSPPVGKSMWRKRAKGSDGTPGIKAKTLYPTKPDGFPEDEWPPDCAFALIQAGMLPGKSIGFITLKSHAPSSHEIAALPNLATVRRIIDEWLLLEYACVYLPMNPDALVLAASKGIKVPATWLPKTLGTSPVVQDNSPSIPFTPMAEVEAAVKRSLAAFNINPKDVVENAINKLKGRV
jgi:hypothetical protein